MESADKKIIEQIQNSRDIIRKDKDKYDWDENISTPHLKFYDSYFWQCEMKTVETKTACGVRNTNQDTFNSTFA